MRRLGIDHGQKRVGIALSDEDGHIALPRETLGRKDPKALIAAVAALALEQEVAEIIVGLPLTLAGAEGASARRARRFGELLEAATGRPVVMWDERLTTMAAERALDEAGVRGKGRRKVVDQVAATLILQSYLDTVRAREGDEPWRGSVAPTDDAQAAPRRRGGRSRER